MDWHYLNNFLNQSDATKQDEIIFKDYLNENLLTSTSCDAFDDDTFYNSYANEIQYNNGWDMSTFNINDIFNHKNIDEIIDDYVDNAFENDTLWFTVQKEITVLRATF